MYLRMAYPVGKAHLVHPVQEEEQLVDDPADAEVFPPDAHRGYRFWLYAAVCND